MVDSCTQYTTVGWNIFWMSIFIFMHPRFYLTVFLVFIGGFFHKMWETELKWKCFFRNYFNLLCFNLVLGISNDQVKRNASFASAIAVHSVIHLHIVTFWPFFIMDHFRNYQNHIYFKAMVHKKLNLYLITKGGTIQGLSEVTDEMVKVTFINDVR